MGDCLISDTVGLDMSPDDRRRYSRNLMLQEIGDEGQKRLLASTVTLVGAGALGSVCSMYLAGSGIGRLRLIDFDTVDLSNLQRQLSFITDDCGNKKVTACVNRLKEMNPQIEIEAIDAVLTQRNAAELLADSDLLIEGSDNPATKYLVTDAAVATKTPYVLGGISQWQGQVMSWSEGHAAYRDLFPEGADADGFTPCSSGGVLGPLPGVIGSLMACEAIKILTGAGEPLYDRIFTFNALDMTSQTFNL